MYSPVSGRYHKSEEINISYSAGNRIFGNDNHFQGNDFIRTKTKNGKKWGNVFGLFGNPPKYCS